MSVGVLGMLGSPLLGYTLRALLRENIEVLAVFIDSREVERKDLERWQDRTGRHMPVIELSEFARDEIPFYFVPSHNDPVMAELVENLGLKLLVNGGTPRILKAPVLSSPEYGVLNIHPGRLPDYRGCTAPEWAVYNDDQVMNTVHFMSEKVDGGPIVCSEGFIFSVGDKYADLRIRVYKKGFELLAKAARKVLDARLKCSDLPSQPVGGRYYDPISDDLLKKMKGKLASGQYKFQKEGDGFTNEWSVPTEPAARKQSVEEEGSLFQKTKPKHFRDKIRIRVNEVVEEFLDGSPQMDESNCPFCHSDQSTFAYAIGRVRYRRCSGCESVYCSPRPTPEALLDFYDRAPGELGDSELLPEVRQNRIDRIMVPRWELLKSKLLEQGVVFPVNQAIEVGAGIGHFIEVMQMFDVANNYVAVEPALACKPMLQRLPGVEVVSDTLENAEDQLCMNADLIFMNSVIEHPASLDTFFAKAEHLLNPGGMVVMVDMHSGGIDLELLRGEAQNVHPLMILQLGSVEGIRHLAERHGLELLESFSMGAMDADILYDYARALPEGHPLHGLSHVLKEHQMREDFQALLRKHLVTGYNGYLLRKPNSFDAVLDEERAIRFSTAMSTVEEAESNTGLKIESERLFLKAFDVSMLTETYINWLNDKDLMQFSEHRHHSHTQASCRDYWLRMSEEGNLFLGIVRKDNGEHIGNISAYMDTDNRLSELSLLIGPTTCQGRGFGGEAWAALIQYLFEKRNIRKIMAGTMAANVSMIKIMERSGMGLECREPRRYLLKGEEIDVLRYGIYSQGEK